ncbi:hypothetical protein [Streptomyces sp. NPDC057494]|uniref:hypothetical protein n=1 Tax=Streptomyces sp. NPDC057494 TaxID=3346148 RepID=UPI00368F4318
MENDHDITLLRDAMDRAADGLPPLPDLAPVAVREGRRRRARSRLAIGTAAFAVVTAGVLGVTLLPRPGDVPAVSTGTGGEAERQAGYQRRMAALLDELLSPKVSSIRPEETVGEYRITAGGDRYWMIASVRPVAEGTGPCSTNPKAAACARKEMQVGGISEMCGASVQYWLGRSEVRLSVNARMPGTPVTVRDLQTVGRDPRFVELVKEADARPVEPQEKRFAGHVPTLEEQRTGAICQLRQRAR